MKNILEKIVDYKKLEVENSKKQSPIKNIERLVYKETTVVLFYNDTVFNTIWTSESILCNC